MSATPDATTSGSLASGHGSTGGRGRRDIRPHGSRGGRARTQATSNNRGIFKGSTEGMNGNVFECYEEQSDRRQYAKTLEVLDGYVRKTLKYSEDLAPLFADTMAVPMVDMPDDLDDDAGLTMKMIFAEEVKTYVKRNHTLKSNLATVYAVIWGQCSDDMKAKIKTHDYYKDKTVNCFWLQRLFLASKTDQVNYSTVRSEQEWFHCTFGRPDQLPQLSSVTRTVCRRLRRVFARMG